MSRLRYVLVGAGFMAGWHAGALLMSLGPLYYLLFGGLPGWLQEGRAVRSPVAIPPPGA